VSNYSATVTSPNPTQTVASLEKAVFELGGQINYSSGNDNNGNLQGRVPFDKLKELRDLARQASVDFQSENRSSSDMRAELRRLSERRAALSRAHEGLDRLSHQGEGLDPGASAVLHELVQRERTSVDQQLDSYGQQLSGVQINFSVSRSG
jgi:hypothetical protein